MITVPKLKDLYQHITPQYAADWKVIGTLLGLPIGELKAIEAGYPTNVKWCCNQMLEKWLEVNPSASWEKLISVIESPAVSSGQAIDKGMWLVVLVCNKGTYIAIHSVVTSSKFDLEKLTISTNDKGTVYYKC